MKSRCGPNPATAGNRRTLNRNVKYRRKKARDAMPGVRNSAHLAALLAFFLFAASCIGPSAAQTVLTYYAFNNQLLPFAPVCPLPSLFKQPAMSIGTPTYVASNPAKSFGQALQFSTFTSPGSSGNLST